MRKYNGLSFAALGVSALVAVPASAQDDDNDDGNQRRAVTVAFGAGLNTAQPGNALNHHILPERIRVGVGDVVNFSVFGLHVIRVYDDGVSLSDVQDQLPDECEVNPMPPEEFPAQCMFDAAEGAPPVIPPFDLAVYYEGLNPLAPPPDPPPPAFVQPSTAVNRVEGVVFLEPGSYLVICAVLPHFNDGMYAWVDVGERSNGAGPPNIVSPYRPGAAGHH